MEHQLSCEQIIQKKLNEVATPDVSTLWEDMEARLDREMPQKEKKRSGFIFWGISVSLLIAGSVFASYIHLIRSSSEKVTTPVAVESPSKVTPPAKSKAVDNSQAQPLSSSVKEQTPGKGRNNTDFRSAPAQPTGKPYKDPSGTRREKAGVISVPPIKKITPVTIPLPPVFSQQEVKPVTVPTPVAVNNYS